MAPEAYLTPTHFPCSACDSGTMKGVCSSCGARRCDQHLLRDVEEGLESREYTETVWVQGDVIDVAFGAGGPPGARYDIPIYGPDVPVTRRATAKVRVLEGTTNDGELTSLPLPEALFAPPFSDRGSRAAIAAWQGARLECVFCRERAGERAAREAMEAEKREREAREQARREREERARQQKAEAQAERQRKHAEAVAQNRERFGSDLALRQRFRRANAAASAPNVPVFLGLLTLAGLLIGGLTQLDRDWLADPAGGVLIRETHRDVAAFPVGVLAGVGLSLLLSGVRLVLGARAQRARMRATTLASQIGCGRTRCGECAVPAPPTSAGGELSPGYAVSTQIATAGLALAVVAIVVLFPGREIREFRDAAVPASMRSECSERSTKPDGVYYVLDCQGSSVSRRGLTHVSLYRMDAGGTDLSDVPASVCDRSLRFRKGRKFGTCSSELAAWTGQHRLIGVAEGRRAASFARRRARARRL